MLYPSINLLRSKVDSSYTLVIMAAKRARDLVEGKPSLTEVDSNKPVTIATNEIAEDLVSYIREERSDEGEAVSEEAVADETVSEEAAAEKTAEGEAVASETVAEETAEGETVAEEVAAGKTAESEAGAEETGAEEAADK